MSADVVLSTKDLAELKGWDRVRAWRWIKRFGYKSGRQWFVDRRALSKLKESTQKPPPDERILVRIRKLEDDIRECARRINVHASELSQLRRR